jgi:hypothetical protein
MIDIVLMDKFGAKDYEKESKIRSTFYDLERLSQFNDIEFSDGDIVNAVKKTINCVKEKSDVFCSLPINHLLIDKGFDGVEPPYYLSDLNYMGTLLFKESIEEDIGIELKNKENFEYGERVEISDELGYIYSEKIDNNNIFHEKTEDVIAIIDQNWYGDLIIDQMRELDDPKSVIGNPDEMKSVLEGAFNVCKESSKRGAISDYKCYILNAYYNKNQGIRTYF